MRILITFIFSVFCISTFGQSDSLSIREDSSLKNSIQDSAIIVPEGLNTEIDSLLSDWFMRHHTYLDSTCVSSTMNIEYPDSVYIQRLGALPTVIEMPYNKVVRSYIDMYTSKRRDLVEYMLGLGSFYFPIFEEILDKNDMPIELKYLPIIESALKPTARSRMGATGLWQFMLGTAKTLGMQVNSLYDERCDPYKSTEKATKYLKQLYNIYNDWNLAIAAYNCGPGNVNKAIKRAGGKTDYWEIYFYLPRETRGYVPAFIAANYVMHYYCEHNLCPVMTEIPNGSDTVVIDKMVHFQQISDKLNIPIDQIRALNPQYRRDIVPGNVSPSVLRLPVQKLYAFIEHQDTIAAHRSEELLVNARREVGPGGTIAAQGTTVHKVKAGETLSTIARKYHTSINSIKKINGLKNDRLRIGQRLIVNG
ncbi:MAG: transglycosylase SLT domain-containing protein [Bacteroidales bacterium]|nr:transglycosylase SLT domain-containing protein [Bacteroidales bacterium]